MKPGIPWSVKGIEPGVREAAKHAARRAGMTLGEWLNSVILDQSDDEPGAGAPPAASASQDFSEAASMPQQGAGQTMVRLEDIAQQLSRLAQRERESAAIRPYETPLAARHDTDSLNRILSRIESNERQTVEAFSAVNERLSNLGRQVSQADERAKTYNSPEEVPGLPALETAIRNVVEHIELSERRTRDSLKSMQDRLADMTRRSGDADGEQMIKASPAFAGLEARVAEIAHRLQRNENSLQASLQEVVQRELSQLGERIETVRHASEALAKETRTAAVGMAQKELRDIEGRILTLLKDAQASLGNHHASALELQKLRGDIVSLNSRIDDIGNAAAAGKDVQALRTAVEQLSARVAQGHDTRPLADMDRRLVDLANRLEQNSAGRGGPQINELDRRIAELDHRLNEAMRVQDNGQAVTSLERHISDIHDRLGRTEQQLGHLDTMGQAINQLYESLEQNRNFARETAEEAANRAVDRMLATQAQASGSTELKALEDGLKAVRDSAAATEQRNQETLEAVHETLEQIVNKLAELETSAAGHQLAANMAQQMADAGDAPAWDQPRSGAEPPRPKAAGEMPPQQEFFDPHGVFAEAPATAQPQAANPFVAEPVSAIPPQPRQSEAGPVFSAESPFQEPADDFIAAARRAAQAAATRTSVLTPEMKPPLRSGANSGFKFSIPFLAGRSAPKPITYNGGKPVEPAPRSSNDNRRRMLILAGIVLLAAASAFAFNTLLKPAKPVKQSSAIEVPVEAPLARSDKSVAADRQGALQSPVAAQVQEAQAALDPLAADGTVTGSLPAKKTDASLTSIVAEPGQIVENAQVPPPEVGTQALRDAATHGDAKAQFIIGSRYLDGQGLEADFTKAAYWYQQAASRGLAPAQYRLATLFERGKGTPLDVATALVWYERAAEGGNIKAMHNTAVIAAGNQAGTPNYDKAFRWFKAAAERGLKDSQFNLAVLYERGLGAKVDKTEAYFWYSIAASQGDADAEKRAQGLVQSLPGSEAAATMARVSTWKPLPSNDDANIVAVTDAAWHSQAALEKPLPGSEEPIREAQRLLTGLGYNVGEPDGKMGTRTVNAIRLFQLQNGLDVDGQVSPQLIEAMRRHSG